MPLEQAAGIMDQSAHEGSDSIDHRHPSGMNVARENERDWAKEAAEAIRAASPEPALVIAGRCCWPI